jgi:hypothetical protein
MIGFGLPNFGPFFYQFAKLRNIAEKTDVFG